jgi:two-component system NtrC family sensor kinase
VGYKLIGAGSIASVVILAGFIYIVLNAFQRHRLADIEDYAHQLSETVKSSTRYDMLLNQRDSVHEIIKTIGRQESIDKVRIYNKDGAIIFSTDSMEIDHMVDMQAEACYACHAADQPLERVPISERTRIFSAEAGFRMMGIINPIYNEVSCSERACHAHQPDQKVLGVIDITIPLDRIDRERRSSQIPLILLVVATVALIGIVTYWLIKRFVLKPVQEVMEATQRVARGDLDHAVPVVSDDEIGQLASSFNSMTANLAEAQRQLLQSDKLASVGRLAAGVAHEINNPLTGVLTYSSFLLSRVKGQSELEEDLEVVVRETKRCRDIVKGLLDFARRSAPSVRWVDLNEVVHITAGIVQNQFALRNTRLALKLDENLPRVRADGGQMQQVLVNLLVNAVDAMPKEGGEVTIETASDVEQTENGVMKHVRLAVIDNGTGIRREHLDKIFEPFFTTKDVRGNGLGLAIVWGIIQEHGGTIDVVSEPGQGTTFTIRLPADKPEDAVE